MGPASVLRVDATASGTFQRHPGPVHPPRSRSDLRRPRQVTAGEDVIFSRILKGRGRGQVSGKAAPFLLSHVPVGPTRGPIQMYQ